MHLSPNKLRKLVCIFRFGKSIKPSRTGIQARLKSRSLHSVLPAQVVHTSNISLYACAGSTPRYTLDRPSLPLFDPVIFSLSSRLLVGVYYVILISPTPVSLALFYLLFVLPLERDIRTTLREDYHTHIYAARE